MLALSRALGDFEYKNNSLLKAKDQQVTAMPEIKCTPITADVEFICLACDGIWDVKTSQETITYLHQACYPTGFQNRAKVDFFGLSKGIESLLDDCCAKDLASCQGLGTDNMTAIIVEFRQQ